MNHSVSGQNCKVASLTFFPQPECMSGEPCPHQQFQFPLGTPLRAPAEQMHQPALPAAQRAPSSSGYFQNRAGFGGDASTPQISRAIMTSEAKWASVFFRGRGLHGWLLSPAPKVGSVLSSCQAVRHTGQDYISGVAAELPSDTGASHLTSAMILLQNRVVIRPKCFHSTQKLLQARCCVCNSAACRLSQGPAFTFMGAESLRAPIPCSPIRVIRERYGNGWSLKFASPALEKGLPWSQE